MYKEKPLTDMYNILTLPPDELLNVEPGRDRAVLFQVAKARFKICILISFIFQLFHEIGSFEK